MEPTDLRVRRTKQLIKTAFFELLEESGFEAVTVKQLTERAGINRGTFYSHYVDKFDLMAACIESIFEEAETKLIRHIPQVFGQQSDTKPYALLELPCHIRGKLRDAHQVGAEFVRAVLS